VSISEGPGWWLATDGRWYPPELHPSDALKTADLLAMPPPKNGSRANGRPSSDHATPPPLVAPPAPPFSPFLGTTAEDPDGHASEGNGSGARPGAVRTRSYGPLRRRDRPSQDAWIVRRTRRRNRRRVVVTVIVLVVAAAALTALVTNRPRSSTGETGVVGVIDASNVSCGTSSFCMAVNAVTGPTAVSSSSDRFFVTTNNGASWSSGTLPVAPFAVSCSSAADCVVLGGTPTDHDIAIATTDGGANWSTGTSLVPTGHSAAWNGLDCPSASQCVTVGADLTAGIPLVLSTETGRTWSPGSLPPGLGSLDGLSCPTTEQCLTIGIQPGSIATSQVAVASADAGATWSTLGALGVDVQTGAGTDPVACSSALHCVAVGAETVREHNVLRSMQTAVLTEDGGTQWSATSLTVPVGSILQGLACPSNADCVAVGGATSSGGRGLAVYTTDGGLNWTSAPLPSSGLLEDLSCPTTNQCVAVGAEGSLYTTNGGKTWHR